MSSTSGTSFLYDNAMERLAGRLRSVSIKQIQRITGSSKVTALNAKAGSIPKTDAFLAILRYLGPQGAREVLEMITGPADAGYHLSRLDEIEQTLKEIRHGIRATAAAGPALESRNAPGLRLADGLGDGAPGQVGGCGRQGVLALAGEGAADHRGVALIETRRLDRLGQEALRRHLTALDNVVSLDDARALVKGDNAGRTGLAYRRQGEDWKALVARENRLWTPSADPRPITDYTGNVVALREHLDEAARSLAPVFVSHAGALLRNDSLIPFHSNVVRIPGKAKCGASVVLTDFVRVTA